MHLLFSVFKRLDCLYMLHYANKFWYSTGIYAQLINTAKLKGSYADSAWEYFTDVIAPEVLQWQGSCNNSNECKSLGDLVSNLVKVASLSEV